MNGYLSTPSAARFIELVQDSQQEGSGNSFRYLEDLLDAFSQVLHEIEWPDTELGSALDWLTADVYELGCGILAETKEERWLAAAVMFRPMFDRSLYTLAVVLNPKFLRKWRACQSPGTNSRPRSLGEEARGIVNRWYTKQAGDKSLMQDILNFNNPASDLIHNASGLSSEIAAQLDRRGQAVVATGNVFRSALSSVLLALQCAE